MAHYLKSQGHSEGLYNQTLTIFTVSSLTAGPFATKLGVLIQHYKLECYVEKEDCCIQDQGHSEGSKCQ